MDYKTIGKGTVLVNRTTGKRCLVMSWCAGNVEIRTDSSLGYAVYTEEQVANELRPYWLQEDDHLVGFTVAKLDEVTGTASDGRMYAQPPAELRKKQFVLHVRRGGEVARA